MHLAQLLQYSSAAAAFVAASLWFWSAKVSLPRSFSVHVSRADYGGEPLGGGPFGGEYVGQAYSGDFTTLGEGLASQSRRSALAATAAGVSAFLQAAAAFIG